MCRLWGLIASTSGLLCVAFGAFGAHALQQITSPAQLSSWNTAVTYQFYHTLLLLILALSPALQQESAIRWARRFFAAGILLFSGSLYTLVLLNMPKLGMLTPVGGTMLLLGWASLIWFFWNKQTPTS